VRWRGRRVAVTVQADTVRYELIDGHDTSELELLHCGEPVRLVPDSSQTRPVVLVEPLTPRPTQPPGREPVRIADLNAVSD
jgi:alpha,alpha-trehalose phosphorylase